MKNYSISIGLTASSNISKIADIFTSSVNKMSESMDRMTKFAEENKKAFEKMGNEMDRAARVLAVGYTAALSAAIFKGQEFEVSVKDLSALTGIVGRDLENLSENAIEMSKVYGTSASEIASSSKLIASAKSELIGIDGAIQRVTESAVVLSKAARMDLGKTTDALTTSLNQFNFGAEQSERVINVLAQASKLGASEIEDTSQAILRSGVAMRLSNISFEEANAIVQVLAKSGLKGVVAGTQLKTAMLRLTTQADEFNPKVVGLETALENLALAELTAEEQTRFFGLEALAAGNIMIENRKLIKKWTKDFTGTNQAFIQAEINMSSYRESLNRLGTAITANLIRVFDKMEPALVRMTDGLTAMFRGLEEGSIWMKLLFGSIGLVILGLTLLVAEYKIWQLIKWAKTIWPIVTAMLAWNKSMYMVAKGGISKLILSTFQFIGSCIPAFLAAMSSAIASVWAFTVALLANPLTWVVVGLVAIGAALAAVVKYWDKWGAAVSVFMGPIGMLISAIMSIKDHWGYLVDSFKNGGILNGLKAIGRVLIDALLHPIEQLLKFISKIPGMGKLSQTALSNIEETRKAFGAEESSMVPKDSIRQLNDAISMPTVINGQQELKVEMSIDSEGRPAIKNVKSDQGLDFSADIGYTNALAGI